MADIKITKVDETWIKVQCSEKYMELDLQDKFQFEVPGAKHNPKVMYGNWDGIIKLYNRQTKKIYLGLLIKILEFVHKQGWSVDVDPALFPNEDLLGDDDITELVDLFQPTDKHGERIQPYDFQEEAVKYCLNNNRATILASTSAGKSLIIWMLVRAYQLMDELEDKKIFLVVPSISLVEQMYNDFIEYSQGSGWPVEAYCQKVSGKYSKQLTKQVVITTWQSMDKMPEWTFGDIGAILVDEVHGAKASALKNLLESCKNTPFRHGFTGTLDKVEVHKLMINGLFGPIKRVVNAKETIDRGIASKVQVNVAMLSYENHIKKRVYDIKKTLKPKERYRKEVDFLYSYQPRTDMILDLVSSMEGNKLVLFDRVEDYGLPLYEAFKERYPDKKAYIIIGDVNSQEREEIRQQMENEEDATIFATFQTMQQGVSIKKLHYAFFVSSSKSVIRVLQSIGRTMRLHDSKEVSHIIDIVDDLSYNKEKNYMLDHAQERISFYAEEQHPVKFSELPIKEDSANLFD